MDHRLVKLVKGFFVESLPTLPAYLRIAVLRLDGDMFESTIDTLFNVYDKVGGAALFKVVVVTALVLYCIVLYCAILYSTALVLYCTVLGWAVLY
jgi:hypothetical protein